MAQQVPEIVAASEAEVTEAIHGLDEPALLKLERYATYRLRSVGPGAARGRTHLDLIGDAITLTLDGTRRWRRDEVEFVAHLIGVMRSLSSHWFDEREIPEASLALDRGDGTCSSPLDDAAGPSQDLDAAYDVQRQLSQIMELFHEDKEASEIIEGMRAGLTGPEIRELLDFSQTQYETVMKRVRRGIDKAFPEMRRHGK